MISEELLERYKNGERDFRGADLRHSALSFVDLRGADLRGADIDNTCWPLSYGGL
jgi:uncharacterized protein YjbI with pentapeptide repeats